MISAIAAVKIDEFIVFCRIPMDFSAALPTFVITLREGVEAAHEADRS